MLMSTNDLRIEIISWVTSQSDEKLLTRIKETIDDIDFEEKSKYLVIGKRPNNTPVIKSEFLKCIQQAEHQIQNNEFLTLENFESEVETW